MKLTPLDIRKQDFTRTFRGYDEDEVQAFLQMVSEQWDEMVDLHRRLELRMQDLENKVRHYERVEEALHEALSTARQNAKHIVEGAEREARHHRQEAEAKARAVVRGAERQRDRLRQEAQELLDRRAAIAARLRALLTTELEMLGRFDQMDLPDLQADQAPSEALDRAVGEGHFFSDEASSETDYWADDEGAPSESDDEPAARRHEPGPPAAEPPPKGPYASQTEETEAPAMEAAYDEAAHDEVPDTEADSSDPYTEGPYSRPEDPPPAEAASADEAPVDDAYAEETAVEEAAADGWAGDAATPEGSDELDERESQEEPEDDAVAASKEEIERIRQILRDLD